jgi:predicted enzyme related to lactoylglutathione lyase
MSDGLPDDGPGTQAAVPIFVTTDLDRALAHYRLLGFATEAFDTDYGFMRRHTANLHIARVEPIDPAASNVACYLYVEDADALYREWNESGAADRLLAPQDTEYGLREGAHVDPDGNLIRFGSPLG